MIGKNSVAKKIKKIDKRIKGKTVFVTNLTKEEIAKGRADAEAVGDAMLKALNETPESERF